MTKPALIERFRNLRGGRMTKHKGIAASFAPQLGLSLANTVSAAALGAALVAAPVMVGAPGTSAMADPVCGLVFNPLAAATIICDGNPNGVFTGGPTNEPGEINVIPDSEPTFFFPIPSDDGTYENGITYDGLATRFFSGGRLIVDNPTFTVEGDGIAVVAVDGDLVIGGDVLGEGVVVDTITVNGNDNHGISGVVAGDGNADVAFADGTITTDGDDAHGVYALTQGDGNALAEQTDVGTIITNGDSSHGVHALAEGTGSATVNVTGGGVINTNGVVGGDGAKAWVDSNGGNGSATVLFTAGAITTQGEVARGLDASILGTGTGNALVTMTGGSIEANNRSADGILINNISTDSGTATVLMQGGTIDVDALQNNTGNNLAAADGILILHRGIGQARAEQSGGTITTNGEIGNGTIRGSHGIRVVGRAGGALATQSGDASTMISTVGDASHGLLAEVTRNGGDTIAQQTGNGSISTDGNNAHGIYAWSRVTGAGSGLDATAEQTGTGTITTMRDGSAGVYALAEGDGDATVNITGGGTITTNGARGAQPFGAHGGFANATNGDAVVNFSAGTLVTNGDDSEGLFAIVDGDEGSARVNMSGGTVTTNGADAEGIVAELDNSGAGGTAFANVTSGMVTTNGDGAAGVLAQAAIDPNDVNNNVSADATVILNQGAEHSVMTSGNTLAGIVPQVNDGADALLAIGVFEVPAADPFRGAPLFYNGGADNPELTIDVDVAGMATTSGNDADALAVWGVSTVPLKDPFNTGTALPFPGANERGGVVDIDVDIADGASLMATGQGSNGIDIRAVSIWAGNSLAAAPNGWNCDGFACGGSGTIDISVDINSNVMGGWGASTLGDETEYAAGLRIDEFGNSDGIIVNVGPDGTLGALSDVAFDISSNAFTDDDTNILSSGDFGFETQALVFTNDGTITGSGYFGYNSIQSDRALAHIAGNGGTDGSNEADRAGDLPVVGFVDANTVVNRGDTFNNNSSNSFNFRRFEDTDGDGIRDTEYVAELDFDAAVVSRNTPTGPGESTPVNTLKDGNDIFNNNGTLRLLTVRDQSGLTATTDDDTPPATFEAQSAGLNPANATLVNPNDAALPVDSFVATPQYQLTTIAGYDAGVYDINNEGVEQGHIRDLETFVNSGTITMMDMETGGTEGVVGDILVITGNDRVGSFADDNDGSATPLGGGAGVFQSNGGQLRLDTLLNQGSPNASQSDVLVVDTTETLGGGATSIVVNNIGTIADAAATDLNGNNEVDEGEGILVVEVLDGTRSAADAFTLIGDGSVDAEGRQTILQGAFAYRLDGPADYNEALPTGSWYLVNDFNAAVVAYEALPEAMQSLNNLGTLQQRVGNRYWREAVPAPAPVETVFCKDASQNFQCAVGTEQSAVFASTAAEMKVTIDENAIWTRIEAAHAQIDGENSSTRTVIDTDTWQIQSGIDALFVENDSGKLIGGLNFTYGETDLTSASVLGTGFVDTEGYGVGGSLTWYGTNGFYVDAQARYSWFESDLASSVTGFGTLAEDVEGTGYALSLEAGKRIIYSDTLSFTLQAQLTWSDVDFDTFANNFGGGEVVAIDGDRLVGRLGVTVDHNRSWQGDNGMERVHLYGLANLTYDFSDGNQILVAGTPVSNEPDALAGELGIGGTYNWADDKYAVHGEVSTGSSLENFGDSYQVKGNLGFRVQW